jgi:hypothetical protein
MAHDVTRGDLDRCGAVVAGERGRLVEPNNGPDAGEDLAGQQQADTAEVSRVLPAAATVVAICALAVLMRRSRWRISATSSTARARSAPAPGTWPNASQQTVCDVGAQVRRCAGRDQPNQQHMEPVDRLGAMLAQVVAMLDHRAQRADRLIILNAVKSCGVQGGDADTDRVGFVALAGVSGRERPHQSGQIRRNVHRDDTVITQPSSPSPPCWPGGARRFWSWSSAAAAAALLRAS